MAKLEINKLGPIDHCKIDNDARFLAFTGAQASGKSTIAKVIFFFRVIKDDIYDLMERRSLALVDMIAENDPSRKHLKDEVRDFLRDKFLRVFGSSWCMDNSMYIDYEYAKGVRIKIELTPDTMFNKPNYIRVLLSTKIEDFLRRNENTLNASALGVPEKEQLAMKNKLFKLFDDNLETVYIPAGRSALTVLSDQIGFLYSTMKDYQKRALDYCTQSYIERTLSLKSEFSEGLEAIGEDFGGPTAYRMKCLALEWISKILKGRYSYNKGEERIFIDDERYVKLNFASSGQQESVWILNLLYYYLVNKNKALFIIEEPESHLFPESQKYITELIALFANNGNSVVLTTHSPYVLGTLNNLLIAEETGTINKKEMDKIIPSEFWLDPDDFSSWFVSEGSISNAMDPEMHIIQNERIDGISHVINDDFDKMMDLYPEGE